MERNRRCQEADTKKKVTDSQSALLQSVLVLLITLQPPLRSPELGVRAEGFLVSIDHIRTTPNPRARREIISPMVIPPSGTTRSKGNAKAGCNLIASHMQASRYGRLCISLSLACGRVKLADRSSVWSFCMLFEFCSR